MGYIFDFQDAKIYEKWFDSNQQKIRSSLEIRLMLDMLKPMTKESILDIGCGVGASVIPFVERGIDTTGLDPSPYMLDVAYKNFGDGVDLYRGHAEDLPFDDNSFNHACLFTTLEFVDDPLKALEETFRVAKDRVFIGVLNRYAIKGIQRRVRAIFTKTIFDHARFYGIWELKQMIWSLLGQEIPITWRTVYQFPMVKNKMTNKIEASSIIQRFPFGAFVGIVVTLVPRFRTRPLALKHQPQSLSDAITGYSGTLISNEHGDVTDGSIAL